MLLTLLLVWGLPVLVGLGFCSLVWSFTKALDFRVAAVIRALAVSGAFSPGYGAGYGFIPVPASMFLFFTPSDSTFLEQAKVSIPPILVFWLCLIPVFLYVGYANKNRKIT